MARTTDTLAGVRVNVLADVFPMIDGEWSTFVADIAAQGVVNPIVWSADGETLVDGRNRLRAWLELGNDVGSCPSRRLAADEDEFSFIISSNIARRSMTRGQLVFAAARAYPMYAERARARMLSTLNSGGIPGKVNLPERGQARDDAARAFRVSGSYVDLARRMLSAAPVDMTGRVSDLIVKVERGELSMSAARAIFDALNYTPSKLADPAPVGKFEALSKAIRNLDSADMVAAIRLMAESAGVRVEIFEK